MRSIDADAAIDAIQKDRETSWKDLENDDVEYRNGCDDGYAYSMQIISERPSVKRKGKWINKKYRWIDSIALWWSDAYECSVCGDAGIKNWHYCPNCGADMRGKQDG